MRQEVPTQKLSSVIDAPSATISCCLTQGFTPLILTYMYIEMMTINNYIANCYYRTCNYASGQSKWIYSKEGSFGKWTSDVQCPGEYMLVGARARSESDQGNYSDDTAGRVFSSNMWFCHKELNNSLLYAVPTLCYDMNSVDRGYVFIVKC